MDNKLIGNENNIMFYNDEEGQARIDNITDFIFICLGLIILSLILKFCWWIMVL